MLTSLFSVLQTRIFHLKITPEQRFFFESQKQVHTSKSQDHVPVSRNREQNVSQEIPGLFLYNSVAHSRQTSSEHNLQMSESPSSRSLAAGRVRVLSYSFLVTQSILYKKTVHLLYTDKTANLQDLCWVRPHTHCYGSFSLGRVHLTHLRYSVHNLIPAKSPLTC